VNKAYSKDFTQKQYTPGQTVTIDIAPQMTISSGRVASLQDAKHRSVSATLAQYNGAYEITSIQKGYDIQQWRSYADTIADRLLREMEVTGFQPFRDKFPLSTGTPGTEPGSLRTWSQARAKITNQLGPDRDFHAAASPLAMVALTDSLKGAVNPGDAISNQYLRGRMKNAAGLNFYESQSVARHTAGTCTNSTPLTNGAVSTGASTIAIDGLSASTATITKGTKFTIADVYAVDPETKQSLGYLQEFNVETTATGSGSAIASLEISPTIYGPTSGSLQNVSALPANDKAITLSVVNSGTSSCNVVYDRDAITLISVPLPAAEGDVHKFSNYDGIQIRVGMGAWDAINDTQIMRVDAVWAWAPLQLGHASLVYGA